MNKGKRTRVGARAAALSGIAVVIFLAVNIALAQLPKSAFELDITSDSLYSVSERSEQFLSGLTEDVEIIVLAHSGGVEERLSKLIYNYASSSPRLTLREIDTALSPAAPGTYGAQDGTVVVRCEATGKSETINIVGFKGYREGLMLFDYTAYAQSGAMVPVALDAEGQLTAAISRVTGAKGPRVYVTEGHGERALGESATSALAKANIMPEPVNLLKTGIVPVDCELLMCINPTADLADEELTMLSLFLKNGGRLLIITETPGLVNFDALLAIYGLELQQGVVADGLRYYESLYDYYGYACIYPVLERASDVTGGISGDAMIVMPRGMTKITPGRPDCTVQPFMKTSENGLNFIDEETVYDGEYIIGALVTENFGGLKQSRLTVISAMSLISDEVITAVPGSSNLEIFMSAVKSNLSGETLITIPERSLIMAYNTPHDSGPWSMFFIGFVPVAFIVCGLSVWLKRRGR